MIRIDTTEANSVKVANDKYPLNGFLIASAYESDRVDIIERITRRAIVKGVIYSSFIDASTSLPIGANQSATITALNNAFNASGLTGIDVENLDDVTLTSLANNQVLAYNSTLDKWVNVAQSGGGGGGTNYVQLNWAFFDNQLRDVFLPFSTEFDQTSPQRYNRYIPPFDGKLVKCSWYGSNKTGGSGLSLTIRNQISSQTYTDLETQTLSSISSAGGNMMTFTNNSFSAGDSITFFVENNFTSAFGNATGTLLFEVD